VKTQDTKNIRKEEINNEEEKKKEESHERYIFGAKWRHIFIDGEEHKSTKPLHETNRQN